MISASKLNSIISVHNQQGGFARCFELVDCESRYTYAGKVIAKAQLTKSGQKQKMLQEIEIHRSIQHEHIVRFYSYFEDSNFIYIILELCNKKSMMELHKRRKTLSEPEIRYYVRQIAHACLYLHNNKIIHRDLKLGNIFINDDMKIKLGDFGLATRIDDAERKYTLCGTPNYLAPEILLKTGHSYQVDVWSLGCIVYTLAVGTPPFETPDLNDTYKRIKENKYTIPNDLSPPLRDFIESMLKADPKQRPDMTSILNDNYITGSYIPRSLPTSCLTTAPRSHTGRLSILPNALEKMALTNQNDLLGVRSPLHPVTNTGDEKPKSSKKDQLAIISAQSKQHAQIRMSPYRKRSHPDVPPEDTNLRALVKQLTDTLAKKRVVTYENGASDAEDPMSAPIYWISKWVDFSDRYGLGFALCDNSYGVRFNDVTSLIMLASENENQLQYIDSTGGEYFFSKTSLPKQLSKKVELLKYFRNYMNKYLANTGSKVREEEGMARLPYVSDWFRTRTALVFALTNGTLQVHFFDHVKLVLCPLLGACTFFNAENEVHTYRLDLITVHGATSDIYKRLKYALDCANHLLEQTKSRDGGITSLKPEGQPKHKAVA